MIGTRICIYIVTYRNPIDLNNNISSILASGADVSIYVINNHSKFCLDPENHKAVTVLHNNLRPDFSTGHIARNWNQALLLGFRDLNDPANDVVVTVQDDVIFKPDWLPRLMELHRRYSFITMGPGDSFCSYLPGAVKKVGLWDERFCNLGFQEGDYFLRSLIYNRDGCSINDVGHYRVHNPVEGNSLEWPPNPEMQRASSLLITSPHWNTDRKDAHISSVRFHPVSEAVFKHKWGISAHSWTSAHHTIRKPLTQSYIMYPYFEKDIEGLQEKGYVVAEEAPAKEWGAFATSINEIYKDW